MCPFRVRTAARWSLAVFLGGMITLALPRGRGAPGVLSGSARGAGLPAPLGAYTLQPAIPSAGGGSTPASPRRTRGRCRNVDRPPVCIALRLIIRARLTPGRQTSPGNPWPCGGGGSHPPCRYLCLHLPFRTLHRGSRPGFRADRNAPLPAPPAGGAPRAFGARLIPDYYPCPIPRLVSCYALLG